MTATGGVLVVAAHPDDEVLGCGGTMARLSREGRPVHVVLLADGESSRHAFPQQLRPELLVARNAVANQACAILGCDSVAVHNLSDNRLDSLHLLDIVKLIEEFVDRFKPSTIFTHHSGDVNVDHRIVHEAVLAACRPQPGHFVKELYFFEVPSSTEWRTPGSAWPFEPNRFVDISASLPLKLKALEAYGAEMRAFPHPRSLEAVRALASWRGATVGVHAAEAFMVGRQIV
jgi:N-acetylglucosamine malate deacetylase 1